MRDLIVMRDTFSTLWIVRCRKPCGRRGDQWCQGEDFGLETCWLASSTTEDGAHRLRDLLAAKAQGEA